MVDKPKVSNQSFATKSKSYSLIFYEMLECRPQVYWSTKVFDLKSGSCWVLLLPQGGGGYRQWRSQPDLWSRYAKSSVFMDRENNQFLKK